MQSIIPIKNSPIITYFMPSLIIPFDLLGRCLTQISMSNGSMTKFLSLGIRYRHLYGHASQSHKSQVILSSSIQTGVNTLSSSIWTGARKIIRHNINLQNIPKQDKHQVSTIFQLLHISYHNIKPILLQHIFLLSSFQHIYISKKIIFSYIMTT